MISNTLLFLLLIAGFVGAGVIVLRKIPQLASLPEEIITPKDKFLPKTVERVKKVSFLKNLSFEGFLQKFLTKIRIYILKIESRIFQYLLHLREKGKIKKKLEKDNYWQRIKNQTREKENK